MSGTTTDPNDPRLTHGVDTEPREQSEVYLVLSDEERAKGWVRPLRKAYVHVGAEGPKYPLRDLTQGEHQRFEQPYVKFEDYPEGDAIDGHYWTQEALDNVGKGCGVVTRMGLDLAETYARDPHFYGATYCVGCRKHLPVGEFLWDGTEDRVGS